MMNKDALEKAARAQCIAAGHDPDEIMPNDGPRWKYYVPSVEAAITAYLEASGLQSRLTALEEDKTRLTQVIERLTNWLSDEYDDVPNVIGVTLVFDNSEEITCLPFGDFRAARSAIQGGGNG